MLNSFCRKQRYKFKFRLWKKNFRLEFFQTNGKIITKSQNLWTWFYANHGNRNNPLSVNFAPFDYWLKLYIRQFQRKKVLFDGMLYDFILIFSSAKLPKIGILLKIKDQNVDLFNLASLGRLLRKNETSNFFLWQI